MSKLTWTSTRPSKPGWYWLKQLNGEAVVVQLVLNRSFVLCIAGPDGRPAISFADCGVAFAGPLQAPAEPRPQPAFRYALVGSYKDPSRFHWGYSEWEFDRAEIEARATRAVGPDGDSSSVTMIIQERRNGRWGRKTTKDFRATNELVPA